jgi:hypothetical protein
MVEELAPHPGMEWRSPEEEGATVWGAVQPAMITAASTAVMSRTSGYRRRVRKTFVDGGQRYR